VALKWRVPQRHLDFELGVRERKTVKSQDVDVIGLCPER
jgi:hypothetical protein